MLNIYPTIFLNKNIKEKLIKSIVGTRYSVSLLLIFPESYSFLIIAE